MNRREYEKTPARELKGRRARLERDVRNGWATIAAGTVVTITGKRGGLEIETDRCQSCGVRVHVRKVEPDALLLLDEVSNP
jgi:hypothetical protein